MREQLSTFRDIIWQHKNKVPTQPSIKSRMRQEIKVRAKSRLTQKRSSIQPVKPLMPAPGTSLTAKTDAVLAKRLEKANKAQQRQNMQFLR